MPSLVGIAYNLKAVGGYVSSHFDTVQDTPLVHQVGEIMP